MRGRRAERFAEAGGPVTPVPSGFQDLPQPGRQLELRLSFLEIECRLGPSVGGMLEESAPRSLDHQPKPIGAPRPRRLGVPHCFANLARRVSPPAWGD